MSLINKSHFFTHSVGRVLGQQAFYSAGRSLHWHIPTWQVTWQYLNRGGRVNLHVCEVMYRYTWVIHCSTVTAKGSEPSKRWPLEDRLSSSTSYVSCSDSNNVYNIKSKKGKAWIIRHYLNRMVRKNGMHLPEEIRKIQKREGDFTGHLLILFWNVSHVNDDLFFLKKIAKHDLGTILSILQTNKCNPYNSL